ncbi:MAG TPA: TonB-dependent receptor [Candidatus Competibacter sp.]|nr:TonB-dependent receptor [Candidatus Competibacter sp.]
MPITINRWVLTLICLPLVGHAQDKTEETRLDEISITATREERASGEVPQAIAVVGKTELREKKLFNVKEALQEIPGVFVDSKNGGFDARLIIRGAGLKANYGIREIMVLRDGVPLTDPDSFSRLDFVDTQDIERIEIAKGPGNLFAAGSSGGAIQIFSKSVFDDRANNLKLGLGTENTQNYHVRYGRVFDNQAVALTATHRRMENDWRIWNQFDTTQTSLKHGLLFDGGSLESEMSYAEANMQLPGAMDKALYDRFVASGEQTATSEAWKHSGRYSKVLFLNSKYEIERGDFAFKPRIYYNTWYHYHPVTGVINESEAWVWNLGADLEGQWKHANGVLVGGITARQERTPDARKYQYGRVQTTTSRGACVDSATATGRILATCSDSKGRLAEIDDATNLLTGIYLQESWRPSERWIVDLGIRYDTIEFTDDNRQFWRYDFPTGQYVPGEGVAHSEKTYRLPAPKLAVLYRLTDTFNLFGMIAQAGQVPSQSEFSNNPELDAPVSRNHEIGLKGRGQEWRLDASLYLNNVKKEIVTINTGGVNDFVNAGETQRKGLELSGAFSLDGGFELGGYYGYADYTYKSFSEPVGGVNRDRAGNQLPFVPKQQYGVFLGWQSPLGWKARLASNTWGEYWLDNANTEKYPGWDWVTNFSLSYERKGHSLTFNADNLFDKHYAMEVRKDTAGKATYAAAAPRTLMLTYRYDFQ